MNLVFYSGGFCYENIAIDRKLMGINSKKNLVMTVIPACSFLSDTYYQEICKQYKPFGLKKILKFNIDQPYSEIFKKTILKSDIIHLGGGNTFYFLKYLRRTGLLKDLKKWCAAGGTLTGLSAGAIIMTKSIHTASFPNFDKDENEENIKNWTGMGLVDFEIFPHYRNSSRYDKAILDYSKVSSQAIYALPDGSGIICSAGEIRFIGKSFCFYQGKKQQILK